MGKVSCSPSYPCVSATLKGICIFSSMSGFYLFPSGMSAANVKPLSTLLQVLLLCVEPAVLFWVNSLVCFGH